MDISKAGHHKRNKYKPGFSNHRVNLNRVKRRRERELERKKKVEDRKRLRSARIRKNLRQAFEDRLANRINLGIREERVPISKRQNMLINTHMGQMKATVRHDTVKSIEKAEHDEFVALHKRPPTPPAKIEQIETSKELFAPWLICLKKVFKMYVLQAMAFKQTKKYAMDEIIKARSSMDKTTWLRLLTDFQLLPGLVSLSEATHVFTKNNFSLSPAKWDLREGGSTTVVAVQTRPIGMAGAQQFAVLSFSDFISALQGICDKTRASIFTCLPTSTQRVMALGCWLRNASNDWNDSIEVRKYRDKITKESNVGDDKGQFLQHGTATPSCILKLQRMYGDQAADYNWWYDYTTPETVIFEHRYSDLFRKNVKESLWVSMEMIEMILSKSVRGLHILQPIQREVPVEENEAENSDEDDMGLETGGGGWDNEDERLPTPAYVERLYKPKTPPTWPQQGESLAFGGSTQYLNRKGLSDEQQRKWDAQATRRKNNSMDSRVDRLAYLGEKARNGMPLKWVVTAKWATEIIVRIADDCTTGDAQIRLQEKYTVDSAQAGTLGMFQPINKRSNGFIGLPEVPLAERVKPKPDLKQKQTEKSVDRKLRDEHQWILKQKKREKALQNRRKEIRKVLKAKRKALRQKEVEDEQLKSDTRQAQKDLQQQKKEHDQMKREHLKLEIAAFKQKRAEAKREKMKVTMLDQDASKRHYNIRFKTHPKQKDLTKVDQDFDLDELNRRRNEAKMKRRQSMMKLNKAKEKDEEERLKVEEKMRLADSPLDKLSIKLHYEIRKNLVKLSDVFSQMDTDGSGSLTYKEFRKGLFNVGVKLSTKEALILCEGLDKDGDLEINYKELARFLAQTKNGEESAAMQIQARMRARRVNTKTLAQKKKEFEDKKAKEHQTAMLANTAEWDKEQRRLAEEEDSSFTVANKSTAASSSGEASNATQEREKEEREEDERERLMKKKKEDDEKKKRAEEALATDEALEKAAESDDDPFGLESDDEDAQKKSPTKDRSGSKTAEDILAEELGESGKSNSTKEEEKEEATPAQIANWDSEA